MKKDLDTVPVKRFTENVRPRTVGKASYWGCWNERPPVLTVTWGDDSDFRVINIPLKAVASIVTEWELIKWSQRKKTK